MKLITILTTLVLSTVAIATPVRSQSEILPKVTVDGAKTTD